MLKTLPRMLKKEWKLFKTVLNYSEQIFVKENQIEDGVRDIAESQKNLDAAKASN